MTTYQKAAQIIASVVDQHRTEPADQLAVRCLDALRDKRIVPHVLRASEQMFKRFHAHCKYLGEVTGRGYEHYYNEAINHAMAIGEWPHKIIPKRIKLDTGDIVEVDVPLPESTTRATNTHLLAAYQVIEEEARRNAVQLPEEAR